MAVADKSIPVSEDELLSDGATGTGGSHEGDLYEATIKGVKKTEPSKYTPDKPRLVFEIQIADDQYNTLYWVNRSFGKGKDGWSGLARLIEAATGIPAGDARQQAVKPSHLIDQMVGVRTSTNDKGYAKIDEIVPWVEGFRTTVKKDF
jgi:hypothetical protein